MRISPFSIGTTDRANWITENVLTMLFIGGLAWGHARFKFSDLSYTLMFVYILLHIYGAMYTYAENPLGYWLQELFHGERNHYDRIAHFSVGFYAYPIVEWIRAVDQHSEWTTSVCTGSLVLAAAGLLSGLTAATHWRGVELLESFGAVYTPQRVVEHLPERIITAAGVSSGIDMALRLLELLVDREAAQAAQLMIEYDPQPPFDAGSPASAPAAVVDFLRAASRFAQEGEAEAVLSE